MQWRHSRAQHTLTLGWELREQEQDSNCFKIYGASDLKSHNLYKYLHGICMCMHNYYSNLLFFHLFLIFIALFLIQSDIKIIILYM